MSRKHSLLVAAGLLTAFAAGCKRNSSEAAAGHDDAGPGSPPNPSSSAPKDGQPPGSSVTAASLTRAQGPAPVQGKGARHLGFSQEALADLYALEGEVLAPTWSAPTNAGPAASRDDDLDTAWTCKPESDRACALGIGFGQSAKVSAIRLYTAGGLDWQDYKAQPRVARVRVHTDQGHVEASLDDGADHRYVTFDEPISTDSIVIEVLGLHGSEDGEVAIAELEIFGSTGPRRDPLQLDPARSFVAYDVDPWSSKDARHTIRQTFVTLVDSPGEDDASPGRRWARGTALLGRKGDRILLLERLHASRCDESEGSYTLVDTQTRMLVPLGPMGGVPGKVLTHPSGEGFAILHPWLDPRVFRAVLAELEPEDDNRGFKTLYPGKKGAEDPEATLRGWGFDPDAALVRGGYRLDESPPDCTHLDAESKIAAQADLLERYPEIDEDRWLVCEGEQDTRVLVGDGHACSGKASVVVLAADGTVLGRWDSDAEQRVRPPRVAPMPGLGWIVEVASGENGRGILLLADEEGVSPWVEGASLSIRTPPACDACDDRFVPDELEPEENGAGPVGEEEPSPDLDLEPGSELGQPSPAEDPAHDELPAVEEQPGEDDDEDSKPAEDR